jgi:hypothetical protein
MRYMLLVYESENRAQAVSPERMRQLFEEHNAFAAECMERGVLVSADPLQPTSAATTVRVAADLRVLSDGPFAATRAARRLLHARLPRPRRGARAGAQGPGRCRWVDRGPSGDEAGGRARGPQGDGLWRGELS